jgi:hypothetical protein
MKVLNIILILIFILSAALQYNDPDPYIWIPIYLYAAVICWFAFRRVYRPQYYIIGLAVFLSYALYLLFDKNGVLDWVNEHDSESIVQTMKATKPWIEQTREFGGLLICVFALVMNMIWLRKRSSQ